MDKWTVARTLDEISRYIELSDPNKFKARAFERAARAVEGLVDDDMNRVVDSGRLTGVSGIGKATSEVIVELVRTGTSRYLEELRAQYPPGIFELLRVPGLGIKKIALLHETMGIGSLDELEAAGREGKLAKLKGFGKKTEEKILEGIAFARKRESQHLLPVGIEVGELVRERLADLDAVVDAEVSGSVRRRLEVIRNVNIVIATKQREDVLRALPSLAANLEMLDDDTAKGLVRNEVEVLFHLTEPASFGTTLLRTTGSKEFVEALETKAEKLPKARTEADVFEKVDIPWLEPERRETADDLKRKKRTKLVHVDDLRGTFHVHTTFSDGRNTVQEMLSAARDRGMQYVGLSDHSKAAYYAGGLTEAQLEEQHAEIARQEPAVAPMRVFRGTEADILPNGTMDYGKKTLAKFDFVIASIHSSFQMPKDEMTARILSALDDPHVTILGHLTGRRLLSREGYGVDFDAIFERAAERGVMIEINGNPQRLDVDWRWLPRAVDRGVMLCINPDAHSIGEYNALITGTWVARKAGLSPKHIFNTRGVEEVEEWFAKRKEMAAG
ncbi:MAG TPA: DNA polymerase/3'-5' exonuclease PolX [Thermoanaerobaculia bacterium]